ncbi:MAG: TonB-dependent receptor [Lentimicrobiaceae bacterium]|jgi:outer membrane receptor for ferrienterochelin and colicins|nr:TonB-dependent receptor [Lentimicrobiaceae bacterium]
MRKNIFLLTVIFLSAIASGYAQKKSKTDANLVGHVTSNGIHIPFANVSIKGTTIGTTTDESGHYQLIHLPPGTHTIIAQSMGYRPKEEVITMVAGETKELKFDLEPDVLGLEEVVITGDRNETNRVESSIIVTTITPKLFASTQSVTLSEGLNFCPGLRIENDCQNCGFNQVRMNGMEGPYSQILINSRPIFSGLAGVYGLELIPAAMIERVEVIRGGGSALYGSNAIAGTINLILKDPINNAYEFGINSGFTGIGMKNSGTVANDFSVHLNASLTSADNKTGMTIYGFNRNREPFDANNDDFSEISTLKNLTLGGRVFHRFGYRNKLIADFFAINEDRRGGDRFDYPAHEANIAEQVKHDLSTAALTYEQFFREHELFSIYASTQKVKRDSYYGAHQSLKDYGHTADLSYTIGAQYNAKFGKSALVGGLENIGSGLKDTKLGYADTENALIINDSLISIPHTDNVTIADQNSNTTGVFAQYEYNWVRLKVSVGARFDHYVIEDKTQSEATQSGNVLSPRLTVKYDLKPWLQSRISYSQGYRAPQIFDEDLHIETSGSRRVVHKNSPDLTRENSNSYMASLDFNKKLGSIYFALLIEGFLTRLDNPFANEYGVPDENGTVVYTRINAEEGASVRGINIEMNVIPGNEVTIKAGFTLQSSQYDGVQQFNEKQFLRTPDQYGYVSMDWDYSKKLGLSASGTYTGSMLVPYFGLESPDPGMGILKKSDPFLDLGFKVRYTIKLNGASLQCFAGIKNIFNAYQDDFDRGINRDPGYIYGPTNPRTFYAGFKLGNFLR